VLVEDLRIVPGAGIIGGVFASRQPVLVEDAERERRSQPAQTELWSRFIPIPTRRCPMGRNPCPSRNSVFS